MQSTPKFIQKVRVHYLDLYQIHKMSDLRAVALGILIGTLERVKAFLPAFAQYWLETGRSQAEYEPTQV